MSHLPATADAVVIGAGIVGASCAHYLAEAGLSVVVIDRGSVASGTTGAGEGNILVSDKEPGPELDLAVYSNNLWQQMAQHIPTAEFERKGGIVVASSDVVLKHLRENATQQRGAGIEAVELSLPELRELEPHISHSLIGAVLYPQDSQVQPMLAAAALLRRTDQRITTITNTDVTGIVRDANGKVTGVETARGNCSTPVVVNAAGTWGAEIAALADVVVPIMPRRGFILVTQPLPPMVHHKVYTAEYLANVASDNAGLETSTVVEGTHSGTILIGASRERVGFDRTVDYEVLSRLAAGAVKLFPFLRDAKLLRPYGGFRPYCPDHLPVIGPDPRVPGLFHACGHEGAGVGLAPASGKLIADYVVGEQLALDLHAFRADRFDQADAHV